MKISSLVIVLCFAELSQAAVVDDERLAAKLRKGDPATLAMFPAAGFRDGVAGFVKRYGLYVVPDGEEAWCQDTLRGRLEPGCYVIAYLQLKGSKPADSNGNFCGAPARWYKAPGSSAYVPISWWPGLASAIARGDAALVLFAVKESDLGYCNR
jgi:hypothetical protein